jgi:hypothetical protein
MTTSGKRQDPLFPFIALTGTAAVGVAALAWQARSLRVQVESLAAENRRLWAELPTLPRIHVPDDLVSPSLPVPPQAELNANVTRVTGPFAKTYVESLIQTEFVPAFESCVRSNHVEGPFHFMATISAKIDSRPVGRPTVVMFAPAPALGCVSAAAGEMQIPYGTVTNGSVGIDLELKRVPADGAKGPQGPHTDRSPLPNEQRGPNGPARP